MHTAICAHRAIPGRQFIIMVILFQPVLTATYSSHFKQFNDSNIAYIFYATLSL